MDDILTAMLEWQVHAIRLVTQNAVYYNPAMVKYMRTPIINENVAITYRDTMTAFMAKYESNTITNSGFNPAPDVVVPRNSQDLAQLLYSITKNAAGVITTASGTDLVPAEATFAGDFLTGVTIDIQGTTDGVQPNWGLQHTLAQDYATVEDFVMALQGFLDGNDGISFTAVGDVLEVWATFGSTATTIDILTVVPV